MVKLKSIYYITTDDVETLIGTHWSNCEFAETANNDSYAPLNCSDESLEELYEDIAWEAGKRSIRVEDLPEDPNATFGNCYLTRLMNQAKLVEALRKWCGVRYEILVWICW